MSLADLIVLGGCAAVEKAAKDAGFAVTVPFRPGRADAAQDETDVESFQYLEPRADGFRNYVRPGEKLQPETLLLDKAYLLDLSAPEMTVLVGGMRALGANLAAPATASSPTSPDVLTNDFFVNLLSPRHRVEGVGDRGERLRDPGQRLVSGEVDRYAPSTSSSAPTPSSAHWPRSMPATTPGRSSSTTSSQPG